MTNDNRNLNNYFLYSDAERPTVRPFHGHDKGEETEFFAVGNWQFELTEDADIDLARSAALSWIAWVEFLEARSAATPEVG